VADGFQLVFQVAGKRAVRSFEQARIVVGRSMVCDVVFESPHLSRKHAEIVREGEDWIIRDLQSRHGLAVNGVVNESRKLASGDRITLAPAAAEPTVLEFRLTDAVEHVPPQVSFGDDPATTHIIASIDLREMAQTLRKSGRLTPLAAGQRPGEESTRKSPEPTSFETSPRLPALALLKSAGEVLMSHETLDEMLQPMVDLIGEHLPGHRVAICLNDAASGELLPRCYSQETNVGAPHGQSARTPPFAISRSILHEASRVRRALLVASASDDPRFVAAVSIRQIGIHSAICVPLYHDDRVEGAVYVDSRRQAAALSGDELEVLSVLGLMLAAGIAQIALRADVARERAIRGRLSRYYSPQVVEQIMRMTPRKADEMMADEYDVSVLFADLGGFTALAESLSAAEAVRVLNLIFERWAADVFARDGTLDKYIGDAVMAVFGAPLRQADHARRAVATALAMQQSLAEFNRQRPADQALTVRIGVNSGRVIAGDIGSPLHRGYTAIGDAVNIASRLESSLAKQGEILIGQATFEQIEGQYPCEPLGPVQLRGKRQSIEVYRVLGTSSLSAKEG
jgi:adenylate cyclase